MKNILKTAFVLGLSVSMISPAAVMAGPQKIKTTEKKSESGTKSVTGITHADSYEELYELLKKQNESTTAGANARGIAMYAEEDTMDAVAETAVESTDTGSSSPGYSGETIDPGFTYDKESGIITLPLSQEDTLLFSELEPVWVQLRLRDNLDNAIASEPMRVNVGEIFKDGVI